jgi:hypothetical protein
LNSTEQKNWRALGAVGKAHNLAHEIRLNPQRRTEFMNPEIERLNKKMLIMDNSTRWNSTCEMIKVLIQQRERVELYIMKHPESTKLDILSESE